MENSRFNLKILMPLLQSCLYHTAFFIEVLLLPFIAKEHSFDNSQIGYLQTTQGLAIFIGAPICGRLCDKIGVRATLFLTYAEMLISFATLYTSSSFWVLFLARFICVFRHGQLAYQTSLAGVTSDEQRPAVFSRLQMCLSIGMLSGFGLGGVLGNWMEKQNVLLVAALLVLALFPLTYTFVSESQHSSSKKEEKPSSYGDLLKPSVVYLIGQRSLAMIGWCSILAILPVYMQDRFNITPAQSSAFGAYYGIMLLIANALLVVRFRKHFKPRTLLKIGCLGLLFGYAAMPFVSNKVWHIYVAVLPFPTSMALLLAVTDTLLVEQVSQQQQGSILGLSVSSVTLCRAFGPLIGGVLLDHFGMPGLCICAFIATGTALAFMQLGPAKSKTA